MERSNPETHRIPTQQLAHSAPHFLRGAIGERDRENSYRGHAVNFNQVSDPAGEHPGFAGPAAGQHEQRTAAMLDRLALNIVERQQGHAVPAGSEATKTAPRIDGFSSSVPP